MKIRPPLFEFDTPNLRSQRQTNTIKTIGTPSTVLGTRSVYPPPVASTTSV